MADSFDIQTIWIRSTRNGNFSHDLLRSIQKLINSFYSDDSLQQQGQTILMSESVVGTKDVT